MLRAKSEVVSNLGRADLHKLEGVLLLEDVLKSYGVGAEHQS
jgi:hypothetical protein